MSVAEIRCILEGGDDFELAAAVQAALQTEVEVKHVADPGHVGIIDFARNRPRQYPQRKWPWPVPATGGCLAVQVVGAKAPPQSLWRLTPAA